MDGQDFDHLRPSISSWTALATKAGRRPWPGPSTERPAAPNRPRRTRATGDRLRRREILGRPLLAGCSISPGQAGRRPREQCRRGQSSRRSTSFLGPASPSSRPKPVARLTQFGRRKPFCPKADLQRRNRAQAVCRAWEKCPPTCRARGRTSRSARTAIPWLGAMRGGHKPPMRAITDLAAAPTAIADNGPCGLHEAIDG